METRNIEQVLHVFYGIHEGKVFVQLADPENNIVYTSEQAIKAPGKELIAQTLDKLFPSEFEKTGIKIPRIKLFPWDGQKIVVSGEKNILECTTINNICPSFFKMIFSYIYENGKF